MRLYDTDGRRLYLNAEERTAFLLAAAAQPPKIRLFAETLHCTGCRLSEALALTPERVDLAEGRIIFNSLKKRRDDVYRSVPVPNRKLPTGAFRVMLDHLDRLPGHRLDVLIRGAKLDQAAD